MSDEPEVKQCCDTLLKMYEPKECTINNCFGMYEFIMLPVASYMGDCCMYDEADKKYNIIFINSLYNKRFAVITGSLYGMLWNDMQRKSEKIAMRRGIAYCDELKTCIVLSSLTRKKTKYQIFCDKLRHYTE